VTDRPKKYRLQKLRLDEISIVDAGACEEAVVTIFKRGNAAPQPGPDDTRLSDPKADAVMAELIETIKKAKALIGELPDSTDPKRLRGTELAIKKLADANKAAAITLRQMRAREVAESYFGKGGTLSDLRKTVAEAEDLPRRLQAHRDQADLDTLREAKATIDRPIHPVDRDRRRVNDALDDEIRARQAQTGEAYVEAMDRILADRKRNRGG
jgi:hypothetical protein